MEKGHSDSAPQDLLTNLKDFSPSRAQQAEKTFWKIARLTDIFNLQKTVSYKNLFLGKINIRKSTSMTDQQEYENSLKLSFNGW